MLTAYLFVFGFETPRQRRLNAAHGYDDEDSAAIWIEAAGEDEALEWGRAIANEFVRLLYRSEGVERNSDWSSDAFAHWLEPEPSPRFERTALASLPRVRCGTYPDFDPWLAHWRTR
jgi:hypothetical protein